MSDERSLEIMSGAGRMLAEALSVQELAEFIDMAEAARVYAQQMKMGAGTVNQATTYKLLAMRKLADAVDAGQAAGTIASQGALETSGARTFQDLGIKKQRLDEARLLRTWLSDEDIHAEAERCTRREEELARQRLLRRARDLRDAARRAGADPSEVHSYDITILHTSVEDLSNELDPDTADLIFTDPPYPAEYLPTWSSLGALGAKVLKPGGLVVAYTGQMFLPEAMARIGAHLDYWWTFAVTHVGAFFQLRARHVQVGWKPVLVYRKPGGGSLPPWTNDIVTEGMREKSGHEWQQSEAEAAYWIEKLTESGGLVVDPFLGSGTTAAVCKRLGRRFVGCDVDPLAVQTSRERVG